MSERRLGRLFIVVGLMAAVMAGCGGDTGTGNSVKNPNPDPLTPTGTVSGVLTDRVTNSPISGATIFILDQSATTGVDGQFTIRNVPANTAVGTETAPAPDNFDVYNVIIDLKQVNVAQSKKKPPEALYPAIAYDEVQVKYTSLGETSGQGGTGSNHDTPVNGFVANMLVKVSKLDANVTIQVVDQHDKTPVDGATVRLFSAGSNNNATGNQPHLVSPDQTTAVDPNGRHGLATFSNVEAAQVFHVVAVKGNLHAEQNVVSPVDNLTLEYLNNQDLFTTDANTCARGQEQQCLGADRNNDALELKSADSIPPVITGTTPVDQANITASPTTSVVFQFSEQIDATGYATALTEGAGGLWNDVHVNYIGPKTGPAGTASLVHTLAWNAGMTQLTVTFATADSSRYSVTLNPVNLKDLGGNPVTGAPRTVTFSTSGGFVAAAPAIIPNSKVSNRVDWLPVPNAYTYRVYVQRVIGAKDGTTPTPGEATSPYVKAGETSVTTFTLDGNSPIFQFGGAFSDLGFVFNSGQTTISYNLFVVAVNTDLSESARSNVVVIGDQGTASIASVDFARTFLTQTFTPSNPYGLLKIFDPDLSKASATKDYTFVVTFSEQMDKKAVETLANWTVSKAVKDGGCDGDFGMNFPTPTRTPTATNTATGTPTAMNTATGTPATSPPTNTPAHTPTSTPTFGPGTPPPTIAVGSPVLPKVTSVFYDPSGFTAEVIITYTQSANADAWTDPAQTVFTFSGTDLNGQPMDSGCDQVCGFNVNKFPTCF